MSSTNAGRIVITGMGVATPVGITVEDFWQAALDGRSGLGENTIVNTEGLPAGFVVGAIPEHLRRELRSRPASRDVPWCDVLSYCSIEQALADAGHPERAPRRWAVTSAETNSPSWSADEGELQSRQAMLSEWLRPGWTEETAYAYYDDRGRHPDTVTVRRLHADIVERLGGPIISLGLDATCASGTRSIAEAVRMIRLGRADMALAVVSSTRLTSLLAGAYSQMSALSRWRDPPEEACKPFDRRRDGMVPAEGGAAVVLETEEHAAHRGAPRVHAAVLGVGFATGGAHPTQPDPSCIADAIERALAGAGIDASVIDVVNAHGTSTRLNDLNEAKALHRVFGPRVTDIGLSACKSIIGHTSHASGVVEIVIAALTLERGVVPGIPTCREPDPECNLPVSRTPVTRPVRALLKNAFGFGAQYSAVVLGRVP